ncbi:polysaccharide deacetylase family protein [Paenibacillus sp. SI8]|uniref:polysaccharide deacetylase family protein n=1 Tax=unclassified Paenibacillus TaxID=185978 RepID=UPI0034679875
MKPVLKAVILIAIMCVTGCSKEVQSSSNIARINSENSSSVHPLSPLQDTPKSSISATAADPINPAAAVINNVKKDGLFVALTFDDGPDDKYTPRILDILKKEQVQATFFVIGEQAKQHPQMIKRIVNEGHVIGNHTWDHPNLSKETTDKIQSEIGSTDDLIKQITGKAPTLFRAPYGAISPQVAKEAASSGHQLIGWSVDTLDWDGKSVSQILSNVRKEVRPGSIILQHFAGGKKGNLNNTVEALPQIISYLKQKGYSFATVPDHLATNSK